MAVSKMNLKKKKSAPSVVASSDKRQLPGPGFRCKTQIEKGPQMTTTKNCPCLISHYLSLFLSRLPGLGMCRINRYVYRIRANHGTNRATSAPSSSHHFHLHLTKNAVHYLAKSVIAARLDSYQTKFGSW